MLFAKVPVLRRLLRCWCLLLTLLGLLGAAAAQTAPAYRFRVPPGPPQVALNPAVLADDERRFLAGLPEVRVALQRAGAPPFERVEPDGEISGLQAEMLGTLARALGIRLRPVVMDGWPAVLKAVQEGEADMVLTLASTAERRRYLNFTLGTTQVPVAVFTRSGAPPLALEQARYALERDYFSNDVVARRFPGARVLTVDTTGEALRRVAEGGAGVYLGSLLEALDLLAREPVPGIELRQILDEAQTYYHFGIRKDWPQLVTILNRGIASWRAVSDGAALAALPASAVPGGLRVRNALPMSPAEAAALAEFAVWRVGAVRGLDLLNDVDARGEHSGIAADYLQQVRSRLGVSTEIVAFASVAEMIDALRAGHIDVAPFLTRTPDRAREFVFSQPYFSMPYMLVGRADAPMYWDLNSLRGKRLALARDHPLLETVRRRYPDIRIVTPSDRLLAMDVVAVGDADAAVDVKLFANLRINRDGGGLRLLGTVEELPGDFAFATTRRAAALVPLIDRALADISVAENDRLLRRWVAVDLAPPFPWRRWAPALGVAVAALVLLALATAWWMRRLGRELRYRRRIDEQLDDIGRTMPGVAYRYILDERNRLARTFYSSGTEAFFGIAPPPGRTVLDFIGSRLSPEHRASAAAAQERALATGERYAHSVPYQHPDGRLRWIHSEAVRSIDREGRTVWTGYVIDISRERELQERLGREARERHLMLAQASHELRAPAHQLALALQAPELDALPPAAARPLAVARDAVRTMGALLDDVLDTARLDAGRLELRPHDFDLHALLQQLREAQRGVFAAKGLTLALEIAPSVPRAVHADPLRLKQVLLNLLSNAAKYTAQGGATLSAATANSDDGAPQLVLAVQDSGRGIAPEQQTRLFEPYVTLADGATDEATPSSGLGLSICRRLTALMGGRIELESRLGGGTTVTLHVPLQQPGDGVRGPLRRDGVLLLCDDDEVARLLLAAALMRLGHEVVQAARGDTALARWRHGDVRMLVTDLRMPGLSGQALAETIREAEAADPGRGRTAIVFCSGDMPPLAGEAGPALADAYIGKPVDLATLAHTLRALQERTPA